MLSTTAGGESPAGDREVAASLLQDFTRADSIGAALRAWCGDALTLPSHEVARLLNSDIARIDRLVAAQVNAILHHPQFQRLESSWRGVARLVDAADREGDRLIRIRLLTASWREVERDLERAIEFDQSALFHKIFTSEFDQPGGSPYGLLLGDYEIHPRPHADHPHDDVETLRRLAGVAAAAFCPFVAGAAPAMFGLPDFQRMEQVAELSSGFELKDFIKWRSLRDEPDSRFVGLVLPRILMRTPYQHGELDESFAFVEDVCGEGTERYLWGNAAYAFGEVAIRAFAESGWLADIRGVRRGLDCGGLVTTLPQAEFGVDPAGVGFKAPVDACISEEEESELSRLGFMPLCECKESPFAAFYSNSSLHKPKTYDDPEATFSARASSMLQYTMCVSRVAHYLKVIGRDKVGSFNEPAELQSYLHEWLMNYVTPVPDASPETLARRPLKEASVEVAPDPGRPGAYVCTMQLAPHYQLDDVIGSLKLHTSISPPTGVSVRR